MRAVQIEEFGGPEVLQVVDLPDLAPSNGQVLVDVESAGVNYADTHQTENSYLAPQQLPLVPGAEVVGRARGGELDGERVVALLAGGGGYAEQALAHPSVTFPIPDGMDDAAALALVLQGTTAWFLLPDLHPDVARRERRGARRRRRGRQPGGPAGPAVGCRPGDRHRLLARPSSTWPASSARTRPSTSAG